MTRFLASVADLREARIAVAGGADIVDFKDPRRGALGALPVALVAECVAALGPAVVTSATIGDLPSDPELLAAAAAEMAATGVTYVKIGFFGPGASQDCLDALAPLARGRSLVAVLFADLEADLAAVASLARAGFAGVMLDTAGKDGRGLRDCMAGADIARFVESARDADLLIGLAGSLKASDVPALLPLAPDYLGFRGALCAGGSRTAALEGDALREVRARIPREDATLGHVGKRIIVGLTIVGADNTVIEQKQIAGVIFQCAPMAGIVVSPDTDSGEYLKLPYSIDALVPAAPGKYSLACNCVEVDNPDFLTSWILRQDDQGTWHATPDRAIQQA